MRIYITVTTIVFTALTLLTACDPPTAHVTWVQSPTCNAPDLGDPGCGDMGDAQDMGCADMADSGSME